VKRMSMIDMRRFLRRICRHTLGCRTSDERYPGSPKQSGDMAAPHRRR
jgi:hypothetical protein